MLEIDGSKFSFKRRHGLRVKKSSYNVIVDVGLLNVTSSSVRDLCLNSVGEGETTEGHLDSLVQSLESSKLDERSEVIQRLTKTKDALDHRKVLSNMAKNIDDFLSNDYYENPDYFSEIMDKMSSSTDLRVLLWRLSSEEKISDSLDLMFADGCLAEISQVNVRSGPLSEFPPSINDNLYCKIVEYGMAKCPRLILFVINMVVRKGEPVLPSHVIKVATLFSTICYVANQDIA